MHDKMPNISDFEYMYECKFIDEYRKIRRIQPLSLSTDYSFKKDSDLVYPNYQEIPAITIIIPEDRIRDLLISQERYIYKRVRKEAELRSRYPSLQTAWDQYQMILTLIGIPESFE